ncbi:MAG: 50S ribosomal protein L22 [Desulfurococcales archaeon]|nr:50S ribosomal protein L22 [Desulfurococcales archaeon]
MPVWRYSVKIVDEERTAKAMAWDSPISPKEAYEIFKVIRGMKLKDAEKLLEDVIKLRRPIPYVRYKLGIAHRKGLSNMFPRWKSPIGRYPVKAAKEILKLLKNVENNADNKNLDVERLIIIHAAAHKGRYLKRWMPRAFGRATPKVRTSVNMEVVVREV